MKSIIKTLTPDQIDALVMTKEDTEGRLILSKKRARFEMAWKRIESAAESGEPVGGTVIDGVCRDIAKSLELQYPVFSRGWSVRTGKDRVQLEAMNVTVSIRGVRVNPGDLLLGDADGVVAIPKDREAEVFASASAIDDAEERIRRAIEGGMRLDEARRKYKYFELQRRDG